MKVMISYSHKDRKYAEKIALSLEVKEHDVWFDNEDLVGGDNWDTRISEGIKAADVIIAVITPTYFNSQNCKDELSYARKLNKKIIPVYFHKDIELPEWYDLRFHRLHGILRESFRSESDFLAAIARGVNEYVENPVSVKDINDRRQKNWRISLAIIGLLFLIVIFALVIGKKHGKKFTTISSTTEDMTVTLSSASEENTETQVSEEENTEKQISEDEITENNIIGTFVTKKNSNLTNIPIYNNPGDTKKIDEIPEGKCCKALDEKTYDNASWYYIEYFGIEGWMRGKFLTKISSMDRSFSVHENVDDIVFVNSNVLKLRKHPKEESYIDKVSYGTEFVVNSIEDGFLETQYKGQTAYIDAHFVAYYGSNTWFIDIGDGKNTEINIRNKPSEKGDSIGKIPEGTVIEISDFDCGWGKITYQNKVGWIKLHYATPHSETE